MDLDVDSLETSFDAIAPRGDELVDLYYTRFFTVAPELAPLFAGADMKRQKAMVRATLVLLRRSLRDLDAIAPKLRDLGARHARYGTLPEHYAISGEVLIGSMAQIAGDAWTPEFEAAWTDAFAVLAGLMIEGANSVDESAA